MAVKRRQKDDNHGTWEDKSQGPLVSDKGREMAHRRIRKWDTDSFTFINLHPWRKLLVIKSELPPRRYPIPGCVVGCMISERLWQINYWAQSYLGPTRLVIEIYWLRTGEMIHHSPLSRRHTVCTDTRMPAEHSISFRLFKWLGLWSRQASYSPFMVSNPNSQQPNCVFESLISTIMMITWYPIRENCHASPTQTQTSPCSNSPPSPT